MVWRWENFEPLGNNPPEENPSGLGNFEFPLRFAGQYHDKETNLFYNMARDYDPSTGRYTTSDPIGLLGGINTYLYVRGNPVALVDRFGLEVDVRLRIADRVAGIPLSPPKTTGYCGSGWNEPLVSDFIGSFNLDLSPSCKRHDKCYATCGADKGQCDRQLRDDIRAACKALHLPGSARYAACASWADDYYTAVDWFGGGAFRAAQSECKCKP